MSNDMIRCKTLVQTITGVKGDFVYLPISTARIMQGLGTVRIEDSRVFETAIANTNYLDRTKFLPRKLTTIAWVQNYSKDGGAEISNFNCVKVGQRLGFDVVGCKLDANTFSYDIVSKADLIIVNNLHCDRHDQFCDWLIQSKKPFVKYDHDYLETDVRLFTNSALNVFISPAHLEFYVLLCGEQIREHSICLPLAFDTSRWSTEGINRIPNSVLVPNYAKGSDDIATYVKSNPDKQFFILDNIKPLGNNVIALGKKEYTDMPGVYRQYETVLHLPACGGAGERVLFEAVLSGCKIIADKKSGHFSWDFNWQDASILRPILDKATYSFWNAIDKVLTKPKHTEKKTISIITRNMGRKKYLKQVLPSWLALPCIDKVIIVDWGVKEDLSALLDNDKLTILQVPDQKTFDQGRIWNIGARYCTSDYIFMVDAEVYFNNAHTGLVKLLERVSGGQYLANEFIICGRDGAGGISGTSIITKKMFSEVNGFCESLPTRGYDEIDLRERVEKSGGILVREIFPGMASHIDHGDELRFENMDKAPNIIDADLENQKAIKKIDVINQERKAVKCFEVTTSGKKEVIV